MLKIYPLSEGSFTVGHDKEFIRFDESSDELNQRATGSLHVEVQPFLVETSKDLLVFDTGLGFKNAEGELLIHENVKAAGFCPEDVTKVLMSHLHKDHAGCITYMDKSGIVKTTFPNAAYYIYRPEADFALATGAPSFVIKDIEPILATSQVHWLDGETGTIDGYITFRHSGGHSPQHIVFIVDDHGGKVFYGGDEAPQLKQLKMRYVAKYDFDGKKAMELREKYAEEGKREGWQFMFYHDVKSAVAILK